MTDEARPPMSQDEELIERMQRLKYRLLDDGDKRISRAGAGHELDAIAAALAASPSPVVQAPDTFWMIELNDGSGWLSSLRGATSNDPTKCPHYDNIEDANNVRNGLPQSLWLKFKTNATEHQWIGADR